MHACMGGKSACTHASGLWRAWWPCTACMHPAARLVALLVMHCMHASGRTLVALLHAMAALHASGLAHLLARHYQHAMRPCMQYYYTNEVNRNVTVLISTNHVLHKIEKKTQYKLHLFQTPQPIGDPILKLVHHGAIPFICTVCMRTLCM